MPAEIFEEGFEVVPRAAGSRSIVARYVREACALRLAQNKFLRTAPIIAAVHSLRLDEVTLVVEEIRERMLTISLHFDKAVLEENLSANMDRVTFELDRGFFRTKSDS